MTGEKIFYTAPVRGEIPSPNFHAISVSKKVVDLAMVSTLPMGLHNSGDNGLIWVNPFQALNMDNSLQNKKILIVGGSSGIGLAVAQKACKAGGKVMIASRSAAEKQQELTSLIGHEIETCSFDVTAEPESLWQIIGDIDHLAVATRPEIIPGPFAETDFKEAQKAFNTKFWGTYRLIQKGRINPYGSIILTSGIAGEKIFRNHSTMCIINSAIEALCRSLAVELAPIRVNLVSPGFVAPKPPEVEELAQNFPAKRIASPDEVADAFIYLMKSAYITGTSLAVDGGARLV